MIVWSELPDRRETEWVYSACLLPVLEKVRAEGSAA